MHRPLGRKVVLCSYRFCAVSGVCVLGNNGHLGLPRFVTCVGVECVCVEWEERLADSSAGDWFQKALYYCLGVS